MEKLPNDVYFRTAWKFVAKPSAKTYHSPLLEYIHVYENAICATDSMRLIVCDVDVPGVDPGLYEYRSGVMIPAPAMYNETMGYNSFAKMLKVSRDPTPEVTVNADLIEGVFAAAKLCGRDTGVKMRVHNRGPIYFEWVGPRDYLCRAVCMPLAPREGR